MRWSPEDLADLAEEADEVLEEEDRTGRLEWAETTFGDGDEAVLVEDDGPTVRHDPATGRVEVNLRVRAPGSPQDGRTSATTGP